MGQPLLRRFRPDDHGFVRRHPERVLGVPEIVPGEPGVKERMRMFAHEWGMSGIKLHPAIGFSPNDKSLMYPIYEECLNLKLSVASHSCIAGKERPNIRHAGCRPMLWDDVAEDFPDLKIVISHCGYPLIEESLMLNSRKNIYFDITRIRAYYHGNTWADVVGRLTAMCGPRRILFGNLCGLLCDEGQFNRKRTVAFIRNETAAALELLEGLVKQVDPENHAFGPLSGEDKSDIMRGNALRVFCGRAVMRPIA